MSFTGIADIDKQILLELSDVDLKIVSQINKATYQICEDNDFWKQKMSRKLTPSNILKWKEIYRSTSRKPIFWLITSKSMIDKIEAQKHPAFVSHFSNMFKRDIRFGDIFITKENSMYNYYILDAKNFYFYPNGKKPFLVKFPVILTPSEDPVANVDFSEISTCIGKVGLSNYREFFRFIINEHKILKQGNETRISIDLINRNVAFFDKNINFYDCYLYEHDEFQE